MIIAFGILGLISVILWLITDHKKHKRLLPPRSDCVAKGPMESWVVSAGRVKNP